MITEDDIARTIWETSRADEGTISATGAKIIAAKLVTLLAVEGSVASRTHERLAKVLHKASGDLVGVEFEDIGPYFQKKYLAMADAILASPDAGPRPSACGCDLVDHDELTWSTEDVKQRFSQLAPMQDRAPLEGVFDAWLTSHDARVKADALREFRRDFGRRFCLSNPYGGLDEGTISACHRQVEGLLDAEAVRLAGGEQHG